MSIQANTSGLPSAINLVPYDQMGALGPSITVIVNCNAYKRKNLEELAQYVADQFLLFVKRAHPETTPQISSPQEFCAQVIERRKLNQPMTVAEILATSFFQSLHLEEKPACHALVVKHIGSAILNSAKKNFLSWVPSETESQAFKEWSAQFIESYTPPNDLENQCDLYEALDNRATAVIENRQNVGKQVYQATGQKQFTEEDLNALLYAIQCEFKSFSSLQKWNETIGSPATEAGLFQVLPMIGDYVHFNYQKEHLSHNIQTLFNEEQLSKIYQEITIKLSKADHPEEVLEFFRGYSNLFGMAGPQAEKLKNSIYTLFDTVFRKKFFGQKEAAANNEGEKAINKQSQAVISK